MEHEKTSRARRQRWQRWWPLLLLLLLLAFRWKLEDTFPSAATTTVTETLGCALACLIAFAHATVCRANPLPRSIFFESTIAGAFLIAGPLLTLLTANRTFSLTGIIMALALVPVVVTVAGSAFGHLQTSSLAGRLWPGLAAVAGLLLMLPEPPLDSLAGDGLLVLAPVLTGVGAAWIRAREGAIAWRLTAALLGATLTFLIGNTIHPAGLTHLPWTGVLLDGTLAGLAVLSLLRVGSVRWSAQFVVLPFAALLQAVRTTPGLWDTRILVGSALLLAASISLLLPPKAEEVSDLDLYVLGGDQKGERIP